MLAQDSRQVRNIFHGKEASALLHRRACTGACAFLLRRICMHSDRCCEHHACADVYVKQVLWTSAYIFAVTLTTGCAYSLMCVLFVHSALGNEGGGVQLFYEGTCCLAWEVIFDRGRDRGVVCVFSIFNAAGSVFEFRFVYTHTHTHTHTARMGYSDVSSGVRMRHWRAQRIQMDKISAYVYPYMYTKYTSVCMC